MYQQICYRIGSQSLWLKKTKIRRSQKGQVRVIEEKIVIEKSSRAKKARVIVKEKVIGTEKERVSSKIEVKCSSSQNIKSCSK